MAMTPADEPSLFEAARVFRLLADESRLRILRLLAARGELPVGAIVTATGFSQQRVSHHLMLLRRGGLVVCRRAGQQMRYQLSAPIVTELLRLAFGDGQGPA
jgi:DNA-binding transcriptional ArsR family regulator